MHPLKQELLATLAELPGLEARPSPVAGGTALFFRGKEFAHFHHDTELDLRLTRPLIQAQGLAHPRDSLQHPGRAASSHWIELRYVDADDVRRIVELVRMATERL